MAISKSPKQDIELQERVQNTLNLKPHEHPHYYKHLDSAWDILSKSKPSQEQFDKSLKDYLKNKQSHHTIDLNSLPEAAIWKRNAKSLFDETLSSLPTEELPYAHKAWHDVETAATPVLQSNILGNSMDWELPHDFPVKTNAKGTKFGKVPFNKALSSGKLSTVHANILPLHYIVNRINNLQSYENATPEQIQEMDEDWHKNLKLRSFERTSLPDIKRLLVENPDYTSELLSHQRNLHNKLETHFAHALHYIEGIPHMILSRGLNSATHDVDRTLASYADTEDPGFGATHFHYAVPLNNIWYSYKLGPKDVGGHNHEHEWLVDNSHPRFSIEGLKRPAPIPDLYSYDLSHPMTWSRQDQWDYAQHHINSGILPDTLSPETVATSIGNERYLSPNKRQLLKSLPIHPSKWTKYIQTPLGAEMALESGLDPELLHLGSVSNDDMGMFWKVHRYPLALPRDEQEQVVDKLVNQPNMVIESALKRPDWDSDMRQKLLQSIKPNNDKQVLVTPWERESRFDDKYRK